MPDAYWWQALWPDPMAILKKIGFKKGMRAMDLCCGDGMFTTPMSILLEGRVTAIDLNPKMLQQAKQAAEKAGAPACEWIEGDVRNLAQLTAKKMISS